MTEYSCTPPRITVGVLKEIVTGYCDTCPHCEQPDHCCQSGCVALRMLADIEAFVAEKKVDKMREFESSSGSITLPTNLAERSLRRCVRHGDN